MKKDVPIIHQRIVLLLHPRDYEALRVAAHESGLPEDEFCALAVHREAQSVLRTEDDTRTFGNRFNPPDDEVRDRTPVWKTWRFVTAVVSTVTSLPLALAVASSEPGSIPHALLAVSIVIGILLLDMWLLMHSSGGVSEARLDHSQF
jgi:hypothetical protein